MVSDSDRKSWSGTPELAARASWTFIGAYALAYTGLWLALLTPIIVTLALRVRAIAPDAAAQNLALVLSAGAAVAMVATPLFGYFSDHTNSRYGMRRPWLISGVVIGSIALVFVAKASSVGGVLFWWCVAQLAYNATLSTLLPLLSDQVPTHQRGTVAGILGVCMPVGQLAGTFIVRWVAENLLLAFLLPAIVGSAAVLLLASVLPDRRRVPVPHVRHHTTVREAIRLAPFRARDFRCAWWSRFLLCIGSAFLSTYQPLFLVEQLRHPPAEVPRLMFTAMLAHSALVVVVSLISGRLSDRWRTRKAFVIVGAGLYALGFYLIALASSFEAFLVGVMTAAIAHGMYFGVDLALITEVLPDREADAARDLGIINIASVLPQVIAPITGAVILTLGNGDYGAMYAIAGVVALTSAIPIFFVKSVR